MAIKFIGYAISNKSDELISNIHKVRCIENAIPSADIDQPNGAPHKLVRVLIDDEAE